MAQVQSNGRGPGYYKRGRGDVWDFIREQGLNYHLGCAIKYIARAGHKGDTAQDLQKAIHYLQNELENLEQPSDDTGERISEALQHNERLFPFSSQQTKEPDSRRVQRVLGGRQLSLQGEPIL